jgi:recombination protein RecT
VFSADFSAGTVVHKSENLFTRGKTVGAYCIAYKKGKPPMLVTVNCDQVDKFLKSSKGGQATMWKDNFDDMIVKHAIKRAFKRQFGIDIAEDEPNQNENDGAPYVRKEINPDAEPIVVEEKPKEKPKGNSRAESPKVIDAETTPVDEAIERKLVNAAIKAKLKELSITTDDDISAYMSKNMTVAGDKPTLDERKVLLTFIEAELAKKQAAFDDDLPE